MKYNNILESAGNTPHIRLSGLFPDSEVWIKDERRNPAGSIKDRIAIAMIEDAEISGLLKPGGTIIEPTSGNTGIGLAMAGAVKGYRVILVMPDTLSLERRKIMTAFGAELILTPGERGMNGSIERALELLASVKTGWMPMQFSNKSNPGIHSRTTANEIIADFPEGFDYMVCGVGTGGHISGTGRILRKHFPAMKIIAVEPAGSAVLSGESPGPHKIQGIGAGFVPDNFDRGIAYGIITISSSEAFEMTRRLASVEGMLAGISTGASLATIKKIVTGHPSGLRILCFAYDGGERYLTVEDLWA